MTNSGIGGGPIRGPAIALVTAIFAALTAGVLYTPGVLHTVDVAVLVNLQSLRTAAIDHAVIALTELGDPAVTWPLSITVFAWLLLGERNRNTAFIWGAAIASAATFNSLVKWLVARERPSDLSYDGVTAFSFPSGHATVNLAIYGLLAILVLRDVSFERRRSVAALMLAFGAAIALSRLYLGAHWISDVAASALIALAVVYLSACAIQGRQVADAPRLVLVVFLALLIFGGVNIARNHATDFERYAVQSSVVKR